MRTGMMLVPIPAAKEGSVAVELKYDFGWIGLIGKGITAATVISLPFIWSASGRIGGWIATMTWKREKPLKQRGVAWLENTVPWEPELTSTTTEASEDEWNYESRTAGSNRQADARMEKHGHEQ